MRYLIMTIGAALGILIALLIMATVHGDTVNPPERVQMEEPFRSNFMMWCLHQKLQVSECLCVERALVIVQNQPYDETTKQDRLTEEIIRLKCEDYRDKIVSDQIL